jgi:hypothetical protein
VLSRGQVARRERQPFQQQGTLVELRAGMQESGRKGIEDDGCRVSLSAEEVFAATAPANA